MPEQPTSEETLQLISPLQPALPQVPGAGTSIRTSNLLQPEHTWAGLGC